jgi:ABC-type multidrug transport system ATPase subunit
VVTGKNGKGKTTLLLMAAGIEPCDKGKILFNQQSVFDTKQRKKIGVSAAAVVLPEFMTGQQLLSFHCQQFQCAFPEEYIQGFNFTPFIHTVVKDLSLGNVKKLSLLTAMAHRPSLLLLDEPTNGLDDSAIDYLLNLLHHYSGQLIVASHDNCFINDHSYQIVELDSIL